MHSTTSYEQHKQAIINNYPGAIDGIHSLEKAINIRPKASKVEHVENEFTIRRKYVVPEVYDRFMNPKDKIVIIYAFHEQKNEILLLDIH